MQLTRINESARRGIRRIVPAPLYGLGSELLDFVAACRCLGISQHVALKWRAYDRPDELTVQPGTAAFPLTIRAAVEDVSAVYGSLVRRNMAAYLPTDFRPACIVDAGAFVGDSAAFYLTLFPEARVIAIEPDAANFQLLGRNLAPYGSRARCFRAGLWHDSTRLAIQTGCRKDTTRTRLTSRESEESVGSITVPDLLRQCGETTIDILKCDIEGAEEQLFLYRSDEWLERTRMIYVELHGKGAEDAVIAATKRHGFTHRTYRELHIFSRN